MRRKMEDTNKFAGYLVVVKNEYCLGGQIVENEYYEDLLEKDWVDEALYDKRDFFGEFALRIVSAKSKEDAIMIASKEYAILEEMLNAYKLA